MNTNNAYFNPELPWPSADEHMIRYNAQEEDGVEIIEALSGNTPERDPYSYFFSIPKLMLRDIEYENSIEEEAAEVFKDYLKSINYDFVDENLNNHYDSDENPFTCHGAHLSIPDPLDRTLQTPAVDETIFTADFVRHLQRTLLTEYPLWRLDIHGTFFEKIDGLTIYPEVVVLDKFQSPPEDLDELLTFWCQLLSSSREKERGPHRRQIHEIKQRLPEALESFNKHLDRVDLAPFVMIAAFQGMIGKENHVSFWGLLRVKQLNSLDLNHSRLNVGQSHFFYVTAAGSLTKVYNEAVAKLVKFNFKMDAEESAYDFHMLEYEHEVNGGRKPTGQEWPVHLDSKDIILDSELRSAEST